MEEKFWCDKCNKKVDEVNVDGYGFGDRVTVIKQKYLDQVPSFNTDNLPQSIAIVGIYERGGFHSILFGYGSNNLKVVRIKTEVCAELEVLAGISKYYPATRHYPEEPASIEYIRLFYKGKELEGTLYYFFLEALQKEIEEAIWDQVKIDASEPKY